MTGKQYYKILEDFRLSFSTSTIYHNLLTSVRIMICEAQVGKNQNQKFAHDLLFGHKVS